MARKTNQRRSKAQRQGFSEAAVPAANVPVTGNFSHREEWPIKRAKTPGHLRQPTLRLKRTGDARQTDRWVSRLEVTRTG